MKAHDFVFFVPLCLKEIKRTSRLHFVRNMSYKLLLTQNLFHFGSVLQ